MRASTDPGSAAPGTATRARRVRVGCLLLLAALPLVVGAAAVSFGLPPAMPERIWAHPGDPWCESCREGVPRYTFRVDGHADEWDPGWCFPQRDGLLIGPPESRLTEMWSAIYAEFHMGERPYDGGVLYGRTGATRSLDGHRWTEYLIRPAR